MSTKKHLAFFKGEISFSQGFELCDNPYEMNTDSFFQWESGWKEALKIQNIKNQRNHSSFLDPIDSAIEAVGTFLNSLDVIGVYWLGALVTGAITLVACWVYAFMSWGFLLGIGLGWIPSLFIAILAGFIWPLLALAALGFGIFLYVSYQNGMR